MEVMTKKPITWRFVVFVNLTSDAQINYELKIVS